MSLIVFTGKRALSDLENVKSNKADKDDITARFDEFAEDQRALVKKIDSHQQEVTRLLLDIVRNGRHET